MTVTMSTESDNAKSAISESEEKTDSSKAAEENHEKPAEGVAKETQKEAESEVKESAPKEGTEKIEAETEDGAGGKDKEESDRNKDWKDGAKEEAKEKVKDENSGKEEEGDSEKDEGDDKDKEVPLLDQPLEQKGKRERKNVQRFNEEFNADQKESPKVEVVTGEGTALGDIPRVDASISRFKNEDLKLLHRLLFKTVGKTTLIKKNIRKFNGFDFKKDSEEYTKKIAAAQKFEVKNLKSICEMLDLPKSGTKDEIVNRVIEFLMEPKDSGKPVDGGRPKRTAAVRANNRGYSSHDDYSSDEREKTSRARRDKGRRPNLKDDTSSDEDFQPNQSDASDDRSTSTKRKRRGQKRKSSDEDSEASLATSEDSDEEPRSKRKRSPAKANNKAKKSTGTGRGRGRPPASAKKTPSKPKKKAAPSSDEESDKKDEGSSSEDEPLVKKAKGSQPPTDDEIKAFIKSILEGANLEEITMKTVCQRVYSNYPDFDLTHKKDFIKTTVKSLIST